QATQLRQAYGTQFRQYQQQLQQLQNDRLSPQQLSMRQRQLQQQFNQNFTRSFTNDFSDPRFQQRYNQLHLQYQGFGALMDPTVQQQLNLTPEQQAQLDRLSQTWNDRMGGFTRAGRETPAELRAKYFDYQRQRANDLGDLLDEGQLRNWERIIGDKYVFPPSAYFPDFDSSTTGDDRTTGNSPTDASTENVP
ncbi:MAG: hypothetical protein KF861_15590, partial [Planctomycetaceae bacterium]|nr:hypothetical protein [Planctomycetaceae bacterium]